MSVLVVGSIGLDTIKTPLGKRTDILGGSATYAAVSASFFSPVNMVAVVGNDFPHRYFQFFQAQNINTEGITVKKGKTFRWTGEYGWDFNDPKTLSTRLNVFSDFDPIIPQSFRKSQYVFLANINPRIQKKVLEQVTNPKLVICDTMNYWIQHSRDALKKILKKVDIFLLNESEAKELTGQTNLIAAAKKIHALGPDKVIIKKGEHGALLSTGRAFFCSPAFLLESILDPTGAGDTFAGGLIGYLAQRKAANDTDLKTAITYGSVMATFAVEDYSLGRLAKITKTDVTNRMRKFRKQSCF